MGADPSFSVTIESIRKLSTGGNPVQLQDFIDGLHLTADSDMRVAIECVESYIEEGFLRQASDLLHLFDDGIAEGRCTNEQMIAYHMLDARVKYLHDLEYDAALVLAKNVEKILGISSGES